MIEYNICFNSILLVEELITNYILKAIEILLGIYLICYIKSENLMLTFVY